MQCASSLGIFKWQFKTYLFNLAFNLEYVEYANVIALVPLIGFYIYLFFIPGVFTVFFFSFIDSALLIILFI